MIKLKQIELPAYPLSTVISKTGLIYIGYSKNWKQNKAAYIMCFDIDGKLFWEKQFPTMYPQSLKLDKNDNFWLANNTHLNVYAPEGGILNSYNLDWESSEVTTGYVLGNDGFYAVSHLQRYKPIGPRISHYTYDNSLVWKTPLPVFRSQLDETLNKESVWEPSLRPATILMSGNRLLINCTASSSGVAREYMLDTKSGSLIWESAGRGSSYPIIIAGYELFLIPSSGYGTTGVRLYDANGFEVQSWDCHCDMFFLVVDSSTIVTRQHQHASNTLTRSQQQIVTLKFDDTIQTNPTLLSKWSGYPVLSNSRSMIYWQDNNLIAMDMNFSSQIIFTVDSLPEKVSFSRLLLTKTQHLVTTCNQELWIFQTNLEPLPDSPWSCHLGNIAGNPVYEPLVDA